MLRDKSRRPDSNLSPPTMGGDRFKAGSNLPKNVILETKNGDSILRDKSEHFAENPLRLSRSSFYKLFITFPN
jgi:hypothetical protein